LRIGALNAIPVRGLEDRVFESWQRLGNFLFTTTSRSALGLTQAPIQWVAGTLSLEVKRQVGEADHSLPSSKVKVKLSLCLTKHQAMKTYCRGQRMCGAVPPFHQYAFMLRCSVKARGQIYLYILLHAVKILRLYTIISSS